jgi:hypothetical protein
VTLPGVRNSAWERAFPVGSEKVTIQATSNGIEIGGILGYPSIQSAYQ